MIERLLTFVRDHGIDVGLAVFASVMAVIQFHDSRKLKRNVFEITSSLSTRFIGRFPVILADIESVVRNANEGVKILVDVAAYGHYSNPIAFNRLEACLKEQVRRGRPVQMLVHDGEAYKHYRERVYPESDFKRERNRNRFNDFFSAPPFPKPTTWESFQARLADEQERHLQSFHASGVQIRIMKRPSQILIWLADDKEAVFSFLRSTHHEVSFLTRDGKVITEMSEIFDAAWNDVTTIVFDGARAR